MVYGYFVLFSILVRVFNDRALSLECVIQFKDRKINIYKDVLFYISHCFYLQKNRQFFKKLSDKGDRFTEELPYHCYFKISIYKDNLSFFLLNESFE